MRKSFYLLILILSVFSTGTHAQSEKNPDGKKLIQADSLVEKLHKAFDSGLSANERQIIKQNRRNFMQIMKENEERRKKEKRRAYIRIGIGIVLVTLLILGWNRRRKNTATP